MTHPEAPLTIQSGHSSLLYDPLSMIAIQAALPTEQDPQVRPQLPGVLTEIVKLCERFGEDATPDNGDICSRFGLSSVQTPPVIYTHTPTGTTLETWFTVVNHSNEPLNTQVAGLWYRTPQVARRLLYELTEDSLIYHVAGGSHAGRQQDLNFLRGVSDKIRTAAFPARTITAGSSRGPVVQKV